MAHGIALRAFTAALTLVEPEVRRAWLRLQFQQKLRAGKPPPRVVFLHVPKCGGTSINYHFKSNFGGARSGMSVQLDSMIGSAGDPEALERARNAFYVAGHFGWSAMSAVSQGAVKFTIVRDPFERLRSLFRFARGHKRMKHPTFAKLAQIAQRVDFAEFCLNDDPDVRALVDNTMARTFASNYFPFEPASAETVDAARTHLDTFDFIIDAKRISTALPRLAAATQTTLMGRDWLNRSRPVEKVAISREDFMKDRSLFARVAQDLEVYEHAQQRAI